MQTTILMLSLLIVNARATTLGDFDYAAKRIETVVLNQTKVTRAQLTADDVDSSEQCKLLESSTLNLNQTDLNRLAADCSLVENFN